MKMTQGYVTDDGTFFESKHEAELHEAEMRLRIQLAHLTAFPKLDTDAFLAVVFEVRTQLRSYLDAYSAATTAQRDQQTEEQDRTTADDRRAAQADGGIGHVSSTEKDLEALLKLPARGHSHVPDVGSSPRPKEVQKRRSKHGVGGGQPDA
jgi:hypothetical protein